MEEGDKKEKWGLEKQMNIPESVNGWTFPINRYATIQNTQSYRTITVSILKSREGITSSWVPY
jgi:hypothetical protein